MQRINHYCPHCRSEKLERCFAVSRELWGWSDHCLECGWRGHSPYWVDRAVPSQLRDEEELREPFADWGDGQGE